MRHVLFQAAVLGVLAVGCRQPGSAGEEDAAVILDAASAHDDDAGNADASHTQEHDAGSQLCGLFAAPVNVPVGVGPVHLAAGDMNRDGHVDLLTANSRDSTVTLLTGVGDGTFGAGGFGFEGARFFAMPEAPVAVAVGDLGVETAMDFVVATAGVEASAAGVFHDYGDSRVTVVLGSSEAGFFTASNERHVGVSPQALALADFNVDGLVDVVTTGAPTQGMMGVMLGRPDGTLGPCVNIPALVDRAVPADMDGDGIPDLVAVAEQASSVLVLKGQGDGTFQAVGAFDVAAAPAAVALGDFNRDGTRDVVTVHPQTAELNVLLGGAMGVLGTAASVVVGGGPTSVAVGDFNGDGAQDLATTSPGDNTVAVLLGHGDGTFAAVVTLAVPGSPSWLVAADLNEDGVDDLGVAAFNSGSVAVLLATPSCALDGGLPVIPDAGTADAALPLARDGGAQQERLGCSSLAPLVLPTLLDGVPNGLVVGQFTNDTRLDVVVTHASQQQVLLLEGLGNGTFAAPQAIQFPSQPGVLAALDLNGDNRQDVVVGSQNAPSVGVMLGQAGGGFAAAVSYPVSLEPGGSVTQVVSGDFNGDGKPDVATLGAGGEVLLLGRGDGTVAAPLGYHAGDTPHLLVAGDFNGDGKADLGIPGFDNNVTLLLGNADNTLHAAGIAHTQVKPVGVTAGDFNADGRVDLAVTINRGVADVLLGNADTALAPAGSCFTGAGAGSAVVADFNQDGKVDLAFGTFERTITVALGAGDGSFGRSVTYFAGTIPDQLTQGDFNSDGTPDLLFVPSGGGSLQVMLGEWRCP